MDPYDYRQRQLTRIREALAHNVREHTQTEQDAALAALETFRTPVLVQPELELKAAA